MVCVLALPCKILIITTGSLFPGPPCTNSGENSRREYRVVRYSPYAFRTPVRGQFSDGTLTEYRYRYRYEYCLLTLTLTLASFTFSFFSPSPYSFCTSRTLRLDLKRHFSKYSTVISFKLNFRNLHTSSIRVHHYNLSSLIDRGHY